MSLTSTTQLTRAVNVMFMRRFLERANYRTHYFNGTSPGNLSRNGGTVTAMWRRIEHLTPSTTTLSEISSETYPTRNGVQPSVTDVTKAVAKYGTHILLTEEADIQNFNGTTAELLDILATNAGRSINMVVRNEMEDNATLVYAAGNCDGELGAIITTAALESVINTLNRNVAEPFLAMTTGSANVGTSPILPAYYAITHPDVAHDVAGLTGFKSVETYAGQVQVLPGEFGYYGRGGYGIRFMATPDASIDTASGGTNSGKRGSDVNADLYTTVVFGKNAVGTIGFGNALPDSVMDADEKMSMIEIINKPRGSAGTADPLNELSTLGWKAFAGAKILNSGWIRGIRSAATEL